MMGEWTVMQESLFYGFSLEDHVPADHLLRSIDRFVDLARIREHLRTYYSETGRPSIDPELMIRMLIVGYARHLGTHPARLAPLVAKQPVQEQPRRSRHALLREKSAHPHLHIPER